MKLILKILKIIERHFGVLLLCSAVLAFFIPQYFLWGEGVTDKLLMLSLFLGSLKIDFSEVFHLKKNIGRISFFVLFNLILLPIIFYYLSFFLDIDTRIGFFLLLSISGAVATPLLASFLDLKILWVTFFVIMSSVLMPFTLPFLVKVFFGISLDISVLEMILFLARIIFIPLVLSVICQKVFPKVTKSFLKFSGSIGVMGMSVFLGIIVAINHDFLSENLFTIKTIPVLGLLFLIFFIRFLIGFFMPYKEDKERWTNSLMFGNMNNGLVILLATEFFAPQVLFVALLSEIPWVFAQPIFQKVLQRFYKR